MAAKNKFMNAMKMPAIADMFSSEADRQRESGDLVTEVPLSELHPFVNHPFEVRDDEDMQKLVDSILSAFPTIEVYLKNRSNHFEIHLELKNIEYLRDFVTVSRRLGLRIDDIESNPAYVGSGLSVYTITVTICSSELKKYKTHHEIIEALKSLDYIYHLEELR